MKLIDILSNFLGCDTVLDQFLPLWWCIYQSASVSFLLLHTGAIATKFLFKPNIGVAKACTTYFNTIPGVVHGHRHKNIEAISNFQPISSIF